MGLMLFPITTLVASNDQPILIAHRPSAQGNGLFWFLCGNEVYTDSLFNKIVLKVFPSKHFTIS